ncbi:tRNA pseudouridine(13) synthase TruD [Aliidiomarina taiwanensis]|uniref:tRNA pseudouridine synthase D n=1 Tax=Aliidiomarina taiwanensis TaxID=946228 RepID=A0A432XAF6_9GAMM|nr:tRNA pseudouridine(13) synthase TruD [Aliidiomarina taiwanensis]RUO44221.1 tRNA pseudouridine(13) synthase TruD [Aliidiomarina taiwanensis]
MSVSETALQAISSQAYAYGKPSITALYKQQPSDFKVNEVLGFEPEPDEKGQHHWLYIEKTQLNTEQVARALAQFVGIQARQVSFSGMKDRQAVTQQWFSVELPATQVVHWNEFALTGARIVQAVKCNRKLRRGTHKWNEFEIRLREVSDIPALLKRIEAIAVGVPNYFGEQRFGHHGSNLVKADGLFSGRRIKDRGLRGIVLSAARSFIFNQYVSARIQAFGHQPLAGDVMQLTGSHSYFVANPIDARVISRLAERDIEITGPMVGRGRPVAEAEALAFEQAQVTEYSAWVEGLERAGLEQSRRAIWLHPEQLHVAVEDTTVVLTFRLGTGSFATSVLREIAQVREYTE